MTQLNQIIAIEKGVRNRADRALTAAYHRIQSQPLLSGIAREYQPRDDEGDRLPSEYNRVQVNAESELKGATDALIRLFDVTLTKEANNAEAKADVSVDGTVLLSDVPVTYLLFLEKQLTDLRTSVEKLPVLDPAKVWAWNENAGAWASEPVQTTKTKKIPRNHVKAPATDKHTAQVEMFMEDVIVGDWTTVVYSGAVPGSRKAELADRVNKLLEAVKMAREAANTKDVTDREAGATIFGYVFGA